MIRKMLSLVLLAVTSYIVSANKQCPTNYARFNKTHSFCLPPNGTCNIFHTGVDEEDKRLILRVHNQLRSKVAMGKEKQAGGLPTASNMMEMEWDSELAVIAQKWASQCIYDHDCNNCRAVEGFRVGQNLGRRWSDCLDHTCRENFKKPYWERRINRFYNEVKFFKRQLVNKYQRINKKIGHFTQVIWATSWRVGCGYTVYQDGDKLYRYYVCNYGPTGNNIDEAIYEPGKPCTGCPANTCCGDCVTQEPTYTGLCQVKNKQLGPFEETKRKGTLVDCNWRTGKPTCNFQKAGKQDWTIKPSLGGGPYYTIKLNGGEKSSLKLTAPIQPTTDRSCLLIVYRKSPANAADKDSSVFVADLRDGQRKQESTIPTLSTTDVFLPYSINLRGKYKTQVVLRFSVPENAPQHIFDLREVVAYDGKCKE